MPRIYKVDPAGHSEGFRGCASGTKEQEAMTLLEKAYKKKTQAGGNFTGEEGTEAVIEVLQNVIGADFKAGDVEVAVATVAKPEFKVLDAQEIEHYLNIIADKS